MLLFVEALPKHLARADARDLINSPLQSNQGQPPADGDLTPVSASEMGVGMKKAPIRWQDEDVLRFTWGGKPFWFHRKLDHDHIAYLQKWGWLTLEDGEWKLRYPRRVIICSLLAGWGQPR